MRRWIRRQCGRFGTLARCSNCRRLIRGRRLVWNFGLILRGEQCQEQRPKDLTQRTQGAEIRVLEKSNGDRSNAENAEVGNAECAEKSVREILRFAQDDGLRT